MIITVVTIILLTIILLMANDILFNKRRNKILKIVEFAICILLIYYIFVSISNYIAQKEKIEDYVKNNRILGS